MHFEETRPGRDVRHQSYVRAVCGWPNLGPAEYWLIANQNREHLPDLGFGSPIVLPLTFVQTEHDC